MVSKKVSKAVTPAKLVLDPIGERESPAAAGLIFLDSRFHGNDNNGCFLIFYEFILIGLLTILVNTVFAFEVKENVSSARYSKRSAREIWKLKF